LLGTLQAFAQDSQKPFIVIVYPGHVEAKAAEVRDALQARGVASYPTFERAASALAKTIRYHIQHAAP